MSVRKLKKMAGRAFLLAAIVLVVTSFGGKAAQAEPNAIQAENALPGTPGWHLTKPSTANYEITGYITRPSVSVGEVVPVHANTRFSEAGKPYTVEVLRLGDYAGAGARRVVEPFVVESGLSLKPADVVDAATGLIEANWPVSFSVDTAGFTSGAFLVKLTGSGAGYQTHVPFTVRDNQAHDYLFLNSHLTWQGYNAAGGNSLYQWATVYPDFRQNWCILWACQYQWTNPATGTTVVSSTKPTPPGNMARQVSFARPYQRGSRTISGEGELLWHEQPLIQWLEAQGYDIGYQADFDLDASPVPAGTKAIVLPGHQEYWTGPMRDHADAAQAAGVGIASFGANQAYWRCRIEGSSPESVGRYTCYKSVNGEPHTHDPLKDDPALASAQFRSTFVGRPEQLLLGSMFGGWINANVPYAGAPGTISLGWTTMLTGGTPSPFLDEAGITAGEGFNALLGGEFDRTWPDRAHLEGVQKLFETTIHPRLWNGGGSAVQLWMCSINWPNACWYGKHEAVIVETPSGARVFNAGNYNWMWGLQDFSFNGVGFAYTNPKIQALTVSLLDWVKTPQPI